jgi:hypothetical protein
MLSDDQKETIRKWAAEGAKLGEIHRRIGEEFDVNMTYLEARMLVSDLQVSLDRREAASAEDDNSDDTPDPATLGEERASESGFPDEDDVPDPFAPSSGDPANVTVSVDQITQPQAMVSGRVTFSDGKQGAWYIDQMGRLGIDPDEAGYRPDQDDVMAFQTQLQETLRSKGI